MRAVRPAGKKAVRKKTAQRKAKLARALPKKIGSESKSTRLVCRYCGSGDLAPSFISGVIADAGNVSVNARLGRPGEEGEG
jgi:hypothetical protein